MAPTAKECHEETLRFACDNHYLTKAYSPLQLLRIIRGFLGEPA